MAEATPDSRDRYVDFLRAVSIMVVVLGHWLIAAIYFKNGKVSGVNALHVVPGLWLVTWVLQVMPVFFFVGGFSNFVTMRAVRRRGGGYGEFISGRVSRLMRPTTVFLAVWIPLTIAVDWLTAVDDGVLRIATGLLTRPLWFIGIYMIMIAFAPMMVDLHRRFGARVLGVMAVGAIAVDFAAIGLGFEDFAYLNFAFVWLLVHQLGFFYADGTLQPSSGGSQLLARHRHTSGRLLPPRTPCSSSRFFWLLTFSGLIALIALTASGVYSPSMVGLQNERSNTNPPTVAIIALTCWQVGLVMLARPRVTRWLKSVRPWAAVIGLNVVIMTMFLWHQTAMMIAVGVAYPLGFPQPQVGTTSWWALRPVWVVILAAVLAPLVLTFGRFERGRKRRAAPADAPSAFRAALGTTYLLIGILGFAVSGFEAFAASSGDRLIFLGINPLQNLIHLLLGRLALSNARRNWFVAGALMLLLGVGRGFGFLGSNLAADIFHLLTGVIFLVWSGRERSVIRATT